MSTHIWVKQLRGHAGKPKAQRLVLEGLGLKHIGDESTLRDTPAIRGMVEKVHHMIEIEVRPGQIELNGARSRRVK
ncbi:MAG: 50S ribosomal protein L30 [Myxococcota bacterium]